MKPHLTRGLTGAAEASFSCLVKYYVAPALMRGVRLLK